MKRKITEVSVFEFFLCMFVILIHVLSEGVNYFPKGSVLSIVFFAVTKLTTFAVPAFIFTSALKLFYKYGERKFSYPIFLLDRIRKIYLPYIIMVIIYYIVFVYAFHIYEFNPVSLIKYILNGDLSAQFYFVVLIMQFYLLMPMWILISKYKSKVFHTIIMIIAIICSIAFRIIAPSEYTHKIFPSYLVFWVLGMYAGMYYNQFMRFLSRYRLITYAGWLVFAVLHCVTSYMEYGGVINNALSPAIVIIFCLFSTFGFYQYAYGLTESLESRGKGFFISISGASYNIYLVHCLIITSTLEILNSFKVADILTRFFITTIVTYLLSIIFCVITATLYRNFKAGFQRSSARKSRKKAARKRYL